MMIGKINRLTYYIKKTTIFFNHLIHNPSLFLIILIYILGTNPILCLFSFKVFFFSLVGVTFKNFIEMIKNLEFKLALFIEFV